MRILILLALLSITLSCGKSETPFGADSSGSCTKSGYYGANCENPIVAGACGGNSDCPHYAPQCNNNNCVPGTAEDSDPRIWFVTDPIRPGVTANCNASNNCIPGPNTDYIYNIMAKGYDSLDDWCMSQAQQSTLPSVRNVSSWTAMISAQPDNQNYKLTTNNWRFAQPSLSSTGAERATLYTNLTPSFMPQSSGQYYGPGSSTLFALRQNKMYDKHGNVVVDVNSKTNKNPVADETWVLGWSGIIRDFKQPVAYLGGLTASWKGQCGAPCLGNQWTNCGGLGGNPDVFTGEGNNQGQNIATESNCGSSEVICYIVEMTPFFDSARVPHAQIGPDRAVYNNNLWSEFNGAQVGSVAVAVKTDYSDPRQSGQYCGMIDPIDFYASFNTGVPVPFIDTASRQQWPIICIANTVSGQ